MAQQQEDYGWLTDDPPENADFPVAPGELEELASLWDEAEFELLEYGLPDTRALPSPQALEQAFAAYRAANEAAGPLQERIGSARVERLSHLPESDLCSLRATTRHCAELMGRLARQTEPWLQRVLNEGLAGRDREWARLLDSTNVALQALQTHRDSPDPVQVCLPPEVTHEQLLADARDLLQHLKFRGGFGFLCFRPAIVRRTQYLWKAYRFAGRLCDSIPVLQDLIAYLERINILSRAWSGWADFGVAAEGNARQTLARLETHQGLLRSVMELCGAAARTEEFLVNKGIDGYRLSGVDWPESLTRDIEAACVLRNLHAARRQLDQTIAPALAIEDLDSPHPTATAIVAATRSFNTQQYRDALREVESLVQRQAEAVRCVDLDRRLREAAPQLAAALRNAGTRHDIRTRLSGVRDAWAWRRAKHWLDHFAGDAEPEVLAANIKTLENQIATLTERLVALRAWQSCYEDLDGDYEKQGALQAWQQLVRRIGRGTGVHAETYRRDARKYMDKCRAAIPVWIMPLHRVAETIEVQAGAFDMVIIDEASQTGPEGLLLQFLGQQCIIVGDDKQISPEAVGVNQHAVRGLMEQYLDGFPFAETLSPASSLFDQALVRYGGNRVTLQEHFRCMPEIIRFSNDLCYQDTPLTPLRQYPPERLDPIVVRHVVDGYREGAAEAVVNRPEAAAVVTAIVDCLKDPRYAGKSMGVICLQGHAQSQLIEQLLLEAVGPAPFEERQLICGDPYSFQGDERDVVFLSLVAATEGDRRMAPLVRESFRQRFNVAVSRAKDQLWLFHSVRQDDLHPDCMRQRLLEYCCNPTTQVLAQDLSVCDSDFERDVAKELIQRGYRVIPAYPSAGKRIDLVVEGSRTRLAVECDGDRWHGPERYDADMARQRILERCGWKFTRVRGSAFYANRQREISRILNAVRGQGIEPIAGTKKDGSDRTWIAAVSGRECLESLGRSQESTVQETDPAAAPSGVAVGHTDSAPEEDDSTEVADEPKGRGAQNYLEHDDRTLGRQPVQPTTSDQTDSPSGGVETAATVQDDQPLSAEEAIVAQVAACDCSVWLRMSCWGRLDNLLEPRERSLVYNVGKRLREGALPTIRQSRWAQAILAKAVQLGFDPTAAE